MIAIRWPLVLAMAEAEQFGDDLFQCDVCGQMAPRDEIATVWAYGIETSACAACRGENTPAVGSQPPVERKEAEGGGGGYPMAGVAYDPDDFPGFSEAEVIAGLTVPATEG